MTIEFADSYIDRLFAERDLLGLYHIITVMEQDRALPEEFWLFRRLREWAGSSRSGIWQYYESLPEEEFERMVQALDRFGLADIAERYRFGREAWNEPAQAEDLDDWIDAHEERIDEAAFDLISRRKDLLISKS